jgi:hypothetical protein
MPESLPKAKSGSKLKKKKSKDSAGLNEANSLHFDQLTFVHS